MFYRDLFFSYTVVFILFLIQSLSRTFVLDARVHLISMEFRWTKRMTEVESNNNNKKLGKRTHKTDDHSARETTKTIYMWQLSGKTIYGPAMDGNNKRINLSFLNSLHYKMLQNTVIHLSCSLSLPPFLSFACSSQFKLWNMKWQNNTNFIGLIPSDGYAYAQTYALVPSANSSAFCTPEN